VALDIGSSIMKAKDKVEERILEENDEKRG